MNDAPILICYDGTVASRRGIEAAAELLGARRAVVVDVFPVLTVEQSTALATTGAPGASFATVNEEAALEQASIGAAHARDAGFDAEPRAAAGGPTWEAITEIADDIDAAVIVLGSRGFTGLRQFVEGSVSQKVAEHSRRPVLIVPPRRA